MADDRRMTTDRFYGGVSNRLRNLRSMLEYVRDSNPSRSQLNSWVISNTSARSGGAVSHHHTFLESIALIKLSEAGCELGEYGKQWLKSQNPETLYHSLSSGVKGFDTILQALQDGPMTDEEIMNLLVSEFDDARMTKPGPAIRHREWVQVLGFVDREDGVNRLTKRGQELMATNKSESQTPPPEGISIANTPLQEFPNVGEKFTAKIDRISKSGNGIIETEQRHINIGPVKQTSVGEIVEAECVNGIYAICRTESVKVKNYEEKIDELIYRPISNRNNLSKVQGVPEIPISSESSPIEFCDECGSMMRRKGELWTCSTCGYENKKEVQTTHNLTETVDKENTASSSDSDESIRKKLAVRGDSGEKLNLDKLRKKAEESAVEEVPENISTATSEKPQYNRSTEVKRYVKARADGSCEGCGEPAPFTSKTGKPYLHAHHIHELSDGGSDTPETVVGLCPNCHYRVHHGEDGANYNQDLLSIVQNKESIDSN